MQMKSGPAPGTDWSVFGLTLPGAASIPNSPDLHSQLRNDTFLAASRYDLLVTVAVFDHEINALQQIDVAQDVALHGDGGAKFPSLTEP